MDGETAKISHSVSLELPELQPGLEEADQQIILHMKHALDTENRWHGLIIAADTYAAVIAVSCFSSSGQCELFQSINTRLVPLHVVRNQIGDQKASALVAFHSLTGCDTTSYLSRRKSKKTLWEQVWCLNTESNNLNFLYSIPFQTNCCVISMKLKLIYSQIHLLSPCHQLRWENFPETITQNFINYSADAPDTWRYFGIVNFWNHFDSTTKNPIMDGKIHVNCIRMSISKYSWPDKIATNIVWKTVEIKNRCGYWSLFATISEGIATPHAKGSISDNYFQKKLLCTTSDTSGSNEIRMEERRIELRAVSVFRKPIKLTWNVWTEFGFGHRRGCYWWIFLLTVKAPKIILIQAKVMKMMKTDIHAISRLLLYL